MVWLRSVVLACALAAGLAVGLASTPVRAQNVYTIGVVPQFAPRKLAGIWLPILQELETRTGLKFQLSGARNIPDFEAALARGDYDFAYMNPYQVITTQRQQGYIPLVRDAGRSLYGILVVRKDSPIQDAKELEGASIAFPAPNALGASLLLRAELDRIVGVKFRPRYVQTHSSVYLHVALGEAQAGGGVMGTFNQQPRAVRDQLRMLYVTRDIPPHPISAHPRVPERRRDLVAQALLDMARSKRGQALLEKVPFAKLAMTRFAEYEMIKDWGLEDYYVPGQ